MQSCSECGRADVFVSKTKGSAKNEKLREKAAEWSGRSKDCVLCRLR